MDEKIEFLWDVGTGSLTFTGEQINEDTGGVDRCPEVMEKLEHPMLSINSAIADALVDVATSCP